MEWESDAPASANNFNLNIKQMEKSKRRRIVFHVVNAVLMLAVFCGMFAISLSAGFAAIGFSILGAVFGAFCRSNRLQKRFYDALIEHKEDLFAGKTITIYADEDTISLKVEETEKKTNKKEKKKE